jgi:hypothetical protein
MEKLLRFLLLALLTTVMYVVLLSIIPLISWIFGGEFYGVIQHPVYIFAFGIVIIPIMLGCLLDDTFDTNFREKD